jgi:hypothetical protein
MPAHAPFFMCHAKSTRLVKKFEEKGDFSHSGKDGDHICELCRCRHVAGWGTVGNFWGIGEQVGHFGVGFCVRHEVHRRRSASLQYAVDQAKAIQRFGFAYKGESIALKRIQEDAEEANQRIDLRAEFDLLRSQVQEFFSKFQRSMEEDSVVAKKLEKLLPVVEEIRDSFDKKKEKVDWKIVNNLQETIENQIFKETHLTETSGGKLVEMSDKTKLTVLKDLLRAVGDLARDNLLLSEINHIHVDDVKIRTAQTVALTYRILATLTQDRFPREDWLKEYTEIWSSLKTVGQKR